MHKINCDGLFSGDTNIVTTGSKIEQYLPEKTVRSLRGEKQETLSLDGDYGILEQ